MGYQIIRQPNDLFAIFSSYTNTIIVYDGTEDEIVEWFADEAAERAREGIRRTIGFVAAGEPRRAYFQFAMTWEEALKEHYERGGKAIELDEKRP